MGAIASQITGVSIVCSDADQRKKSKLRVTGLCEGNSPVTDEFPSQRASNAENISIRWRHHQLIWCSTNIQDEIPAINFESTSPICRVVCYCHYHLMKGIHHWPNLIQWQCHNKIALQMRQCIQSKWTGILAVQNRCHSPWHLSVDFILPSQNKTELMVLCTFQSALRSPRRFI